MRRPIHLSLLFCLVLLGGFASSNATAQADGPDAERRPLPGQIDLVLALDSSGSMDGLYESARDKFWAVVTEISRARPEPDLRIGLITYGGVGRESRRNIIVASDLTYDFDDVSHRIDRTKILGGEEFVGGAVHTAMHEMKWRQGALKIIFVAGNEGVDQDKQHPFLATAKEAHKRGIRVNAIYCGGADDVISAGWRSLAKAGDGTFANIDQNHGTVYVASPYDKDLTRLSSKLNKTFRFFGKARKRREAAQAKSDDRAKQAGAPVAAERAAAKATSQYGRVGDLIRASEAKDFDWSKLKRAELPEDLRSLSLPALKAHIAKLRVERAALEKQIKDLASKRDAHVAKERARLKLDDGKALDRVLRDAIRTQAKAAGFKFPAAGK